MTRTLLAILVVSAAIAQDQPQPSPRHIEVPDPLADQVPEPAPAADPADVAVQEEFAEPVQGNRGGGGVGSPRRDQREAAGEPPQALSGKFTVVQLTEGGVTEDFRIKMDRAGKALHQDCITVAMVFDFGSSEAAALPKRIRVVERQECYKGGLGRYLNEMALDLPVAWTKTEAGIVMTLPEIRATSGLVRLRRPEGDGLGTAPQWLGPQTEVDRAKSDYVVLAELSKGRKPEGPAAVHLTSGQQVLHLEPQGEGGPFGD